MYETATGETGPVVADLRSDTVTRPTGPMRAAMADAEVGDDVYGDDPTVARLEAVAAERFGKEAALFCPSGTQTNLLGLLSWCGRGEEILVGETYHTYSYEARGASVLGGIALTPLPVAPDGGLSADQLRSEVKADDSHFPVTRLVSMENTVSGRIVPLARGAEVAAAARSAGLIVHLDGARLMNAAVALGASAAEVAGAADSVSVCLSKGLGAPVGSVLAGPRELVDRARRLRKMVGGGMRQAGVIAAAGLYALERHVDRLAEDHARAKRLATRLSQIPGLTVDPAETQTNMVFVAPEPQDHADLMTALRRAGVRVNASKPRLRLVTHLDLDDAAIERAATAFERFYESRAAA